jgi:hypothetical protein
MDPTAPSDATTPRPTRIRRLLSCASHERDTARFWSLAIATQLIDDHLADLSRRVAHARYVPYRRRVWQARRAWEVLRVVVVALLRR